MSTELAVKHEEVDAQDFATDCAVLAGLMIRYGDLVTCRKMLDFDQAYAWKLKSSPQYAKVRDSILSTIDPQELYRKADAVVALIEETTNYFDGTPASRIAAVGKICDLLGYNAPQEHKLTAEDGPTIKLTLEPAKEGDNVIELPPEAVGDIEPTEDVGEDIL